MPHEPTAACEQDHCAWHNEDEPATGVADGVLCHECLHWYPTEAALIEAHADRLAADVVPSVDRAFLIANTRVEDIHSCPLCSHDF
jgi:hypothetical protein